MASGTKRQKDEKGIGVARIAAGGTVLAAVITGVFLLANTMLNKGGGTPPTPSPTPLPLPTPKKMKRGLCKENPQTKDVYKFDISPFDPRPITDLSKPLGGDSVNPGHEFKVKTKAPGFVYDGKCWFDGTHEGIVVCGKDEDAGGSDTDIAEIRGWINGAGGITHMTVFYLMPCEVPDDGS